MKNYMYNGESGEPTEIIKPVAKIEKQGIIDTFVDTQFLPFMDNINKINMDRQTHRQAEI